MCGYNMVGKLPSTSPSIRLLLLISSASLLMISGVYGRAHQPVHPIITQQSSFDDHAAPTLPDPPPILPRHNVTHGCLDAERSALLRFKAGLSYDPRGRLSSWRGFDCCRWTGVACDSVTGAVLQLDLRNPYNFSSRMFAPWNLSGRIDPSLLHLRWLRHLDLSGNSFHGIPIPGFIGSFQELRYLNLSYAGFTGSIPPQLGNLTRLQYLDLSIKIFLRSSEWFPSRVVDGLEWPLRVVDGLEWVSGLPSLRHLAMNGVDLSAVGSADWVQLLNQRLPSLVELHLGGCSLGSIAASLDPFVNFTSLEVIDLRWNVISSTIPRWLSNITSLVHIDMSFNNLHGPIPVEYLSMLPRLESLGLSKNENLTADVAQLLGRGGWPRIKVLGIYGNKLYGEIPASIGNLTSLVELDLSYK